jgi:hypothetical protein
VGCPTGARPSASCSFGAQFTGVLDVATTGNYDLTFGSDDAGYLFIDGDLVLALPGQHGYGTNSVPISLSAGQHSFEVQYYNGPCCGAQIGFFLDDGVEFGEGVPEPATWAMMIAGFGLSGAALRRRRGVTA